MKTKARVIFTRSSTRFVSAQKINGSITVFELLGCEQVSFGEILRGALDELGNQDIYNETPDEGLSVFVHERDLSVQDGVENHFARLAPEISHKEKASLSWVSRPIRHSGNHSIPSTHEASKKVQMSSLKTTLAALCVGLAAVMVYTEIRCHGQSRRKTPRPVWEIIHRTDLGR